MTFHTTRVVGYSNGEFTVLGDLTIRDVTKQVELTVEYGGAGTNPWGQEVWGFSITTEIDREEFGLTWNQALGTGGVLVGRKIKIEIEGEANRRLIFMIYSDSFPLSSAGRGRSPCAFTD